MTRIPSPPSSPESRDFWDGLAAGELRIPYCQSCTDFFFPPMPGCPACGADEPSVTSRTVSGRGRLFSWFVAHHVFHEAFAEDVPYVVLEVELDEGPRVNARLVGAEPSDLYDGMPLIAEYEPISEGVRLAFSPHLNEECAP